MSVLATVYLQVRGEPFDIWGRGANFFFVMQTFFCHTPEFQNLGKTYGGAILFLFCDTTFFYKFIWWRKQFFFFCDGKHIFNIIL